MSDGALEVQVLRSAAAIREHHDAWRPLAVREGNPFLTPEWFDACTGHLGVRPFVVLVRNAGEVCGVVPMVVRSRGPLSTIGFPGDRLGDGFRPLTRPPLDPETVGHCAGRAIARSRGRIGEVELFNCDASKPWPQRLADGLGSRWSILARADDIEDPVIEVAGRSWDEYLAESVSRRTRKETRRRFRRLEEAGESHYARATAETAGTDTDTLLRLHDLRWDELGGSAFFDEGERATIRCFNEAAAAQGWLRLVTLSVDGEPVSSELAWRLGDRQSHFQGGFDPAWERLGVGMAVFTSVIGDAFAEGATLVDLGRGLYDYKAKYMTSSRRFSVVVIGPRVGLARGRLLGQGAARRLAGTLPDGTRAQVKRLITRRRIAPRR